MPDPLPVRLRFLLLAVLTMAVGLWVHRGGGTSPAVRDVLGDALWAMMIAWGMGTLAPGLSPGRRAVLALAVCAAVELSQLLHSPWLDAVRRTAAGRLVLGSDFDGRDLLAYAVGVGVAWGLERTLRSGRR
ncbi:MAG: DUF2809 domain-containing protein [Gemmatimonadaceae bacterium]|nr:DUF2809 domain-containing protein [Gemmatimonadaceae bacterium]